MNNCDSKQLTNCDINARFCWAILRGDKDRDWVLRKSQSDGDFTIVDDLKEWEGIRNGWKSDESTIITVPFMVDGGSTDGHTVLSYKYNGKVYTFQANFGHSKLKCLSDDIFDMRLNVKIANGDRLFAKLDFQIEGDTIGAIYTAIRYLKK